MKPQRRNVRTPGRTPSRNREPQRTDSASSTTDLDPVEVYCRIRPLDVEEKCVKMLDDQHVQVASTDQQKVQSEIRTGRKLSDYSSMMKYTFSRVFGETTSQKHLFDCVGAPLVDDLVRGKNGLLFTYGITSSGKTYTMTGTGDDQGILPRCLDMVFNSIEDVQARKYVFMPDKANGFDVQSEADAMIERQQREILPGKSKTKCNIGGGGGGASVDYSDRQRDPSKVLDIDEDSNYAVFVSFVEIYNNYIYDLLEELPYDPITGNKPPQSKILREDMSRVMFVHNVTEMEVKSTEQAFDILVKGQKRRKVAHTVLNAESSRSHSVFNIRLVQAPLDPSGKDILTDKNRAIVSQLSLVDLAGSERTNRTKNSGDRLKEAGQINQSLMVLRQCIDILRDNQKQGSNKMVPYRDSKVTHLFKNYFDGEGKVRMIVCVNPKAAEYDETLHVMRFSEAAQEVQVHRAHDKPKFVDEGFVRGRRRLASQGIDLVPAAPPAKKKASVERLPHAPVPISDIYRLPPFPQIAYDAMSESDSDLHTMRDYLQGLAKVKQKQLESVHRKQESFRQLLMTVDKDQERLRRDNSRLSEEIIERESLIVDLNNDRDRVSHRLQTCEKENRMLRHKMSLYEHEKKELENELHDKDWELNKNDYEREKMRAEFERQVAQAETEYEQQLNDEKRRIQQAAHENLSLKDRKLRLLKNIMNQSDVESLAGELAQTPSSQQTHYQKVPSSARTPAATPVHTPSYATPTQSSRDKKATSSLAGSQPRSRPQVRSAVRPVTRGRARSPPATLQKPTPVRNHRRSRSAGADRWLDHRPENVAPLDTLLQPKMKKKKSVGKLEVKDTNKASKYVLTTQNADHRGHVETKLVKGEVKASAGGGSSVVFTEVETLKQTSPGDKKRQYIPEGRDDYEGQWTDTEERCNLAIEGHGVYSRIRQFDKTAGALV